LGKPRECEFFHPTLLCVLLGRYVYLSARLDFTVTPVAVSSYFPLTPPDCYVTPGYGIVADRAHDKVCGGPQASRFGSVLDLRVLHL
jgi:hypothetical protein